MRIHSDVQFKHYTNIGRVTRAREHKVFSADRMTDAKTCLKEHKVFLDIVLLKMFEHIGRVTRAKE